MSRWHISTNNFDERLRGKCQISTQFKPFPVAVHDPKTGQATSAQISPEAEFLVPTHLRTFGCVGLADEYEAPALHKGEAGPVLAMGYSSVYVGKP